MSRVAGILVSTMLLAPVLFRVTVQACPACVEGKLLEADLVVVGRVGDAKGGFLDPPGTGRRYALYEIDVREVLRGDQNVKSVMLAYPEWESDHVRKPSVLSKGANAVWVLKRDVKNDCYRPGFPVTQQGMLKVEEVRKIVPIYDKLEGGTPVNGLQLFATIRKRGHVEELTQEKLHATGTVEVSEQGYALTVLARNVSDSPITVCNYSLDKPVSLSAVEPSGKTHSLSGRDVYDQIRSWVRPKTPDLKYYRTLMPGSFVRLRSISSRILPECDEMKIRVEFETRRDGVGLPVDKPWTGRLRSNAILARKASKPAKQNN